MGVREQVKRILAVKQNKRYERLLAARRVTYAEWLDAREREWAEALEGDRGKMPGRTEQFALFLVGRGRPAENAIDSIRRYFIMHPAAQLVYGDEDVWETGDLGASDAEGVSRKGRGKASRTEKGSPWFKPDWSPDLLDECFYFGSLVAVRGELLKRMPVERAGKEVFEEIAGPEGVSRYRVKDLEAFERWIYWCVCAAGGYRKGNRAAIGNVSRILFHAEGEEEQRRYLRESEQLRQRRQVCARDFRDGIGEGQTVVSVIVPSRDNPEVLKKCLGAVERTAEGLPFEILVVDNGSRPENREKINLLKQELINSGVRMTYLYQPMEFNFSRMCNMGAAAAEGELLLFLNDDVELAQPGCLWELAAYADRDYTGAVGLKLLYPDSGLIQHDGIVNLPVGPVHKLQFHDDNECYYYGRNRFNSNCIAVTGACLMVEASKFREAGGFREDLKVAYNDVELGFKLYELGYYNMVVNRFHARHYESLSRGGDESPERQRRLEEERELLYRLHPDLRQYDPYYPAGLERQGLDSRITPAYVSSGNRSQGSEWKPFPDQLEELRRDECLMVRVETAGPGFIQGYCVVLGDNNACYDKYLLLLPEESGKVPVYMRAEGQYRPDLEENLPDQENVALGGFWVSRQGESLERGSYRIAAVAVNRITGLKLWNESGKSMRCRGGGM